MKSIKKDKYLIFGLLLVFLSTGLFSIDPATIKESSGIFSFLFLVHYIIPVIYIFVLRTSIDRGFSSLFGSQMYSGHIILLVLFNISAFSLNREMIVFYESAPWLTVLLVFENSLLIAVAFLKKVPKWLRTVLILTAPPFLLLHIHQTFITLPMSLFGVVGGLFLGIGLLIFVPSFYMVAVVRTLKNLNFSAKDLWLSSFSILAVAIVIGYHFLTWKNIDDKIQNGHLDVDTPFYESELPTWITVAKNIKDDYLTEAYLKSDMVYQHYSKMEFANPRFGRYDEKKIHDPLVTLCIGINKKQALEEKSRIRVLNFLYDKRHQTADRFWSGRQLSTDQVVTNVQVFPEERLTYSELVLTIANNAENRWGSQGEAVYTFQLPAGGVITSLSLWIEGNEEKAILTTKSKAETAYNTIVGRERRDPSVIYWMEGNKARIRVFPCTPDENRKFKVGITAPLKMVNATLQYQAITFQGPNYQEAVSSINIVTNGSSIDSNFSFKDNQDYISWNGRYSPNWTFSLKSQPLSSRSFSHGNETFISKSTQNGLTKFTPALIYLDVTNNWTKEELEEVRKLFPHEKLKILDGPENSTFPSDYPNFTLFPYHKISNLEQALVITKGDINTPNLEDLKDSEFKKNLFTRLGKSIAPTLVLDLGSSPSDFNQSLKEFGVLSHHQIRLNDLRQFVSNDKYPDPAPTPHIVEIAGNGVSIEKVSASDGPQGSDHLMRLFYYQSIMDQIGKRYFLSDGEAYIEEALTNPASMANVVTPLSSLIVLESKEDYDRFEIARNKDSLGNATISNQGAVPEPHEWALIIAGLSLVIILYFKKGASLF